MPLTHLFVYLLFKYNKLLSIFHIPSWICCNLEGNEGGGGNDDGSSSVEMDVYEGNLQENDSHGEACNAIPFLGCSLSFCVCSSLLLCECLSSCMLI